MGKFFKGLSKYLMLVLSVLFFLVVGGLFLKGTFLGFPILSMFPVVVHKFLGWGIMIAGTVWSFLKAF